MYELVRVFLADDKKKGMEINPELIKTRIDDVRKVRGEEISEDAKSLLLSKLINHFKVVLMAGGGTIQDKVNTGDQKHQDWLKEKREKIEWNYWDRYKDYVSDSFPYDVVKSMDDKTDEILNLIGDPEIPGNRRGLVVGHVQSGKTASQVPPAKPGA
jgi:hypothetical protein